MRDYVVSTLGAAVRDNVDKLLTPNLNMHLVCAKTCLKQKRVTKVTPLRLNRYMHPYWPLVLSSVSIPLDRLPSTGIEDVQTLSLALSRRSIPCG